MALDPRTYDLAEKLLDYSIRLTGEDTLLVVAETPFENVMNLIGECAASRGAGVLYQRIDTAREARLIERSDDEELAREARHWLALTTRATARIRIDASEDPQYLSGIEAEKIKKHNRIVTGPALDIVVGDGKLLPGMKWNLCGYPSHAGALSANMRYEEYADFVFDAMLAPDWRAMGRGMRKHKRIMDGAQEVRILVPGDTDLRLSLAGRGAEVCAGKYNMPDGEFFYGPVEGSVRGHIRFPYETIYDGTRVSDVRLVFGDDGRAIVDECTAAVGQEFLRQTLRQPGADMPGELGIGCNGGITHPIGNILFDEKIGGTVHLAMGDSYKVPLSAGGGLNESAEHWDLIAELRPVNGHPGGQLYVDGKLVQEDGEWL